MSLGLLGPGAVSYANDLVRARELDAPTSAIQAPGRPIIAGSFCLSVIRANADEKAIPHKPQGIFNLQGFFNPNEYALSRA
jgi:hypothetical protein